MSDEGMGKPPTEIPEGVERLLSKQQVAAALGGVTTRKVDQMVSSGAFPRPDVMVGRLPRWTVGTFNAWVNRSKKKG